MWAMSILPYFPLENFFFVWKKAYKRPGVFWVCMCIWVCLLYRYRYKYVSVCVCVCTHIWHMMSTLLFVFWRVRGLSLAWSSSVQLGWLVKSHRTLLLYISPELRLQESIHMPGISAFWVVRLTFADFQRKRFSDWTITQLLLAFSSQIFRTHKYKFLSSHH